MRLRVDIIQTYYHDTDAATTAHAAVQCASNKNLIKNKCRRILVARVVAVGDGCDCNDALCHLLQLKRVFVLLFPVTQMHAVLPQVFRNRGACESAMEVSGADARRRGDGERGEGEEAGRRDKRVRRTRAATCLRTLATPRLQHPRRRSRALEKTFPLFEQG